MTDGMTASWSEHGRKHSRQASRTTSTTLVIVIDNGQGTGGPVLVSVTRRGGGRVDAMGGRDEGGAKKPR